MLQPIIIFIVALISRLVVGYIFFGGTDLLACFQITEEMFASKEVITFLPYIPVVKAFIWFGGALASLTKLPPAFCYKLIPLFFDVLVSVLLYSMMRFYESSSAFSVGVAYAAAPLPLIIHGIHMQWESIWIFFMLLAFYVRDASDKQPWGFFLYGALFACSLLIKPVILILIPFFFLPYQGLVKEWGSFFWRCAREGSVMLGVAAFFLFLFKMRIITFQLLVGSFCFIALVFFIIFFIILRNVIFSPAFKVYLWNQIAACAGAGALLVVAISFFYVQGENPFRMGDATIRYLNQGCQLFGLQFASLVTNSFVEVLIRNRAIYMIFIGLLALFYYCSKLSWQHAVLLSFSIILAFSGVSPQYYLWMVPHLLIAGYYRLLVFFQGAVVLLASVFYVNPLANIQVPYQSAAAFAPLRSYYWLAPSYLVYHSASLSIMRFLGNCLIPLICCVVIVALIQDRLKGCSGMIFSRRAEYRSIVIFFIPVLTLFLCIVGVYFFVDSALLWGAFNQRLANLAKIYFMTGVAGRWRVEGPSSWYLNSTSLLYGLTIIWSVVMWRLSKKVDAVDKLT